jgi:hypothetical protein
LVGPPMCGIVPRLAVAFQEGLAEFGRRPDAGDRESVCARMDSREYYPHHRGRIRHDGERDDGEVVRLGRGG